MQRRWSVSALLVTRLLLVANGTLLASVGVISLLFVDRPAGVIFAGVAWLGAGALYGCVPLTDPYRHERRGRRPAR